MSACTNVIKSVEKDERQKNSFKGSKCERVEGRNNERHGDCAENVSGKKKLLLDRSLVDKKKKTSQIIEEVS